MEFIQGKLSEEEYDCFLKGNYDKNILYKKLVEFDKKMLFNDNESQANSEDDD